MSPFSAVNKITNKLSGVEKPDSFDTITKYSASSIFPNKQVQEWANKGIYKVDTGNGVVILGNKAGKYATKGKAEAKGNKHGITRKKIVTVIDKNKIG